MTLKCIAGIVTPDRGRIVLNGRVLFDSEKGINLPPQQRKLGNRQPEQYPHRQKGKENKNRFRQCFHASTSFPCALVSRNSSPVMTTTATTTTMEAVASLPYCRRRNMCIR